MNLKSQEYIAKALSQEDLDAHPLVQFETWFNQAIDLKVNEPNAMSLATVSPEATPSIRTVLLKSYDEEGFLFFSSAKSKKTEDMMHNPNVALHFAWLEMERQIKIQGRAEQLSALTLFKHLLTRPKGTTLKTWIPNQSQTVSYRSLYETQFDAMKQKFLHNKIPFPNFWHAYRVTPLVIEFWQGAKDHLHDRFEYRLVEGDWKIKKLSA